MIIRTVFVILLFIANLNFVNAEEHRMEYFVLSPHIITEQGKPTKGAILDYFNRYIIPRLSKPITWGAQETPLARILVMLKKGEIPFIPFLLKKSERESYLHYSKKPYFITRPAILVRSWLIAQALRVHTLHPLFRTAAHSSLVRGKPCTRE